MKKSRIAVFYKSEMGRCVVGAFLVLFTCLLPFVALAEERVYFYHNDHLGSPVAVTEASGNVVWKADYEPFGTATTTTETISNTHQFTGKEVDSETMLYYFGARYFDPSIGRFLTQDPALVLGENGELPLGTSKYLNMYTYSLNNSYRFVDPDGRNPLLVGAIIFGLATWGLSEIDSLDNANTVEINITVGVEFINPEEVQRIIDVANEWEGTPYLRGGKTKEGADCSGSTWGIYHEAGFDYPYSNTADFSLNPRFRPSPYNIPQVGDVGLYPRHMVIYDSNADKNRDVWSASHPDGRPYGPANSRWYEGPVQWYRYYKP